MPSGDPESLGRKAWDRDPVDGIFPDRFVRSSRHCSGSGQQGWHGTISPVTMFSRRQVGKPVGRLGWATQAGRRRVRIAFTGEVAERLNAPVLKTGVSERAPWVRIPPSPLGLAMQSDAMCGRNPRFYRGFLRFYRVARETNPGFRQCNLMQTHHHLMSGEWHQFWHLSAPLWAPRFAW